MQPNQGINFVPDEAKKAIRAGDKGVLAALLLYLLTATVYPFTLMLFSIEHEPASRMRDEFFNWRFLWIVALAFTAFCGWVANGWTLRSTNPNRAALLRQGLILAAGPALAMGGITPVLVIPLMLVSVFLAVKHDPEFLRAKALHPGQFNGLLFCQSVVILILVVSFSGGWTSSAESNPMALGGDTVRLFEKLGVAVACYALLAVVFNLAGSLLMRAPLARYHAPEVDQTAREWLVANGIEPSLQNVKTYLAENAGALFAREASAMGVSPQEYVQLAEKLGAKGLFHVFFVPLMLLFGNYMVTLYLLPAVTADMIHRRYRPQDKTGYGVVRGI